MEKIEDRGKRLVYILPLKQGLVTLGRGRLCDIYFKDNTISRFHATITKTSKGFILKDLRSKFGTLVRVTRPIILDRSIHFQIRRNILAFDLIKSSKFWCCFGIRNEEEPPKITQVTGVNDRTSLQTQQNVYNLLSIVIKMESSWIVRHELTMGEQGIDVFGVRWNAEDSHIAAACSDGTVKIYNLLSGNLVRSLNCRQTIERMPVTAIRWRPMESQGKTKNVILVTTADGAILHWHGTSGKILHTTTFQENQALCCDYTLDATAYSVGCKDFSVQIYDEETKQQRQIMHAPRGEKRSHGNRVFAVKFYTNDILLSGGWDNSVIVWDVRSNDIIRTVLGPHLCADAMDTKEDQLLTGSYLVENQLQIWNLNEGYNIHTETILTESERPVMLYAAQYSKSDGGNFYVAGGAGGDEAHFYHSDSNTKFAVLTNLPNAVYGVDWANSDSRVAIGCGDGGVRIFRVIHSSN